MKGKELLETYPRIAKVIREWFIQKMLDNLSKAGDTIPQEFKNQMMWKGVTDDVLTNMIDKNPSMLFEVFDSLHVYIGIAIEKLPETEQVVFNYYVCPKGNCLDSSPQEFLNRKDVEHYAMLAAVQYIDNNFDEFELQN